MDQPPSVQYAKAHDGIQLAYQVFGDGPRDVLLVWGGISHIELLWDDPNLARIFRRLSSFARVIQFDRRGTGMSDRPGGPASLEDRVQDLAVVLDAAGSHQAAIFGESEGGPTACLFAATLPHRTSALILYGPVIRMVGENVGQGRYAAERIPGARYVELPGDDHLLIGGDPDPLVEEIEEFLTGIRPTRDPDRTVATIVFSRVDRRGRPARRPELGAPPRRTRPRASPAARNLRRP